MAHTLSSTGYTVRSKSHINMVLNVDITNINNNIFKFLQSSNLSVFGYDVSKDLYYGKKHKNDALQFHFVLKVVCKGNNLTHIEINVLHDDKLFKSSLAFTKNIIRYINKL